MLVLKNKVSNTKRKYQNSYHNDKLENDKNLWAKSGRSRNDSLEGEYSFRNAHQGNPHGQSKDGTGVISEVDRKKRMKNTAIEKSSNKENR